MIKVAMRLIPLPTAPTSSSLTGFITRTKSLSPSDYPKPSFFIYRRTNNPPYKSAWKFSRLKLGAYNLKSTRLIRSSSSSSSSFSMSSTSASAVSTTSPSSPENQAEQVDRILVGKEDDHGGVIVDMTHEPLDASLFVSLLNASISQWKLQGKKGVWIKLPIELANLIEPAVKAGFYFHHAEPKYLMLVRWLPSTTKTLPANASHRVGIGAFVLNEKNEVLVVQEKSGRFRGTGIWKFPTGVVDEGEDICDAAVREVKEETGIDAKFVEILAFRQSHKSFFEKSDLFFVCMLQALSFDIQPQETEIEAAQWMPFEEYSAQPFVHKNGLFKYISNVCLAKKGGRYAGFTKLPTETSFSAKKTYLYLNREGLNYP